MQGNDKAITSLIRSMKRTLRDKHGIDVPHSALRASYLLALGENPHAFAGREQEPQGDVKGSSLADVKISPLMKVNLPGTTEVSMSGTWRTLYLAPDDIGCLGRFALDNEGKFLLPDEFEFNNATLERQFAEVPRVSRYGLPDYLAKAKEFYKPAGIEVADTYEFWHHDSGDDGGDQCKLIVAMPQEEWKALLRAALDTNPSLEAEVAEWVGLHYHRLYAEESAGMQLDWVERYLASLEADEALDDGSDEEVESAKVDAKFEWTYQDGKTGSVDAYLELDTALIVFQDHIPDDVWHESVRTQIRVPNCGDALDTFKFGEVYPAFIQRTFAGHGDFKVDQNAVSEIANEYDLPVFRR